MPAQRTTRQGALAGAGTTAALLAATVGGALVVAGLLGAGVFPSGPGDGSAAPLRIAAPPARERATPIVLPAAATLWAQRYAAAAKRPRRSAPDARSRPKTSQGHP